MSASSASSPLGKYAKQFVRLRIWLADHFQFPANHSILLWAALIGFIAAWSCISFKGLTDWLHHTATGEVGGFVETFRLMPPWRRLVVPIVGGLLAGIVLYLGNRKSKQKSSTDYMEAVVVGDGNLSPKKSLNKCLSAMFSGASGASIGREGPLVLLASLVSSLAGRIIRFPLVQQRQIVACGAAAGIACAYHAPFSGTFFVAEIVLGSLAIETLGPMMISSVVATLTIHAHEGASALYAAPEFNLDSNWQLLPYILLGITCGLIAPLYLGFLKHSETLFSKTKLPTYLRLALGGLFVGIFAVYCPEVAGNGQALVFSILNNPFTWQALAFILLFKLLATGATFGSGAVGGVFTITLFTGSATGFLFGTAFAALFPQLGLQPSACGLVGMGAFLTAATGAPVMAIIMVFELTMNYNILLPVILAALISYHIARSLTDRSLYESALRRKGKALVDHFLAHLRVGDLMDKEISPIAANAGFGEVVRAFLHSSRTQMYVVSADSARFLGTISLHDIKPYLDQPELESLLIASDVMRDEAHHLSPEQSLASTLRTFSDSDTDTLPVIDPDNHLLGIAKRSDVLQMLAGRYDAVA